MSASTHVANPFEMLVNPQAILHAMESSTRLQSLNRKVCRPLDKPAPSKPAEGGEIVSFDATVDESVDDSETSIVRGSDAGLS